MQCQLQTEINDMWPSRTISVRFSSSVSPVMYMIWALLLERSKSWISMRYHRLSSGQNSSALLPRKLSLMSAYVSNLPGPCRMQSPQPLAKVVVSFNPTSYSLLMPGSHIAYCLCQEGYKRSQAGRNKYAACLRFSSGGLHPLR